MVKWNIQNYYSEIKLGNILTKAALVAIGISLYLLVLLLLFFVVVVIVLGGVSLFVAIGLWAATNNK